MGIGLSIHLDVFPYHFWRFRGVEDQKRTWNRNIWIAAKWYIRLYWNQFVEEEESMENIKKLQGTPFSSYLPIHVILILKKANFTKRNYKYLYRKLLELLVKSGFNMIRDYPDSQSPMLELKEWLASGGGPKDVVESFAVGSKIDYSSVTSNPMAFLIMTWWPGNLF